MRFRDKNEPLHHPILKPANLPDFLTVARSLDQEDTKPRNYFGETKSTSTR